MDQSPKIPYYTTTDLNDDPAKSDTVCRCIENDIFSDLPSDWKDQEELPKTFYRAGIFQGMDGKGATRIDTILSNAPGAHACHGIRYLWEVGKAFDHCPILARIAAAAFKDIINTVARPVALTIPDMPKGKTDKSLERGRRRNLYLQLWVQPVQPQLPASRCC